MSVTVIIPVFGDVDRWMPLAERAEASAWFQTREPEDVVISVGATLKEARNEAAFRATTEWLCFLDSDDELDPGYIEVMLAGSGDLRQPSTLGVTDGVEESEPTLLPSKPLLDGNYLVIGTLVRRDLFQEVGGFRDWKAWEDWDCWVRCWIAGAEISACPEAIYRINVRPGGRNDLPRDEAVALYTWMRSDLLALKQRATR